MKKLPLVAIVGRANAGKSSLFNRVVGMRQAIVHEKEGTTRDSVSSIVTFASKSFWLVDTAGMKSAEDQFEATINEQINDAVDVADVILVVADHTKTISEEDRRVAKIARKSGKPVLLVLNKNDKRSEIPDDEFKRLGIKTTLRTSAEHNAGISDVLKYVVDHIPKKQKRTNEDHIKLAILGRPNVGKSHLFNTLAKKQQAIVSDVAGTTRDVNRTTVGYHSKEIELLDTAGIRRSGKIERGVEKFSVLRSLWAIEEADICLLVMDVNEHSTKLDQKIAGMIKDAGKGMIIVISKWDTAPEDERHADRLLAELSYEFDFVPWAPVVLTSSVSGKNVSKILELAMQIHQRRTLRIKTPELNTWLAHVIADHAPAGLKNSHPKLKYITQTGTNPLQLTVHGTDLNLLHWSYKRYMERKLRESYELEGTALSLKYVE